MPSRACERCKSPTTIRRAIEPPLMTRPTGWPASGRTWRSHSRCQTTQTRWLRNQIGQQSCRGPYARPHGSAARLASGKSGGRRRETRNSFDYGSAPGCRDAIRGGAACRRMRSRIDGQVNARRGLPDGNGRTRSPIDAIRNGPTAVRSRGRRRPGVPGHPARRATAARFQIRVPPLRDYDQSPETIRA
jgi:hypothetical protein